MKILLLILMAVGTLVSNAQNSWTVQVGKKTVLKTDVEDTTKNRLTIAPNNRLPVTVTYNEPKRKDWARTLLVYDAADNELLRKDVTAITLSTIQLKNWSKKTKRLYVYTLPVSLNPSIAIRVRRVHLCTLVMK